MRLYKDKFQSFSLAKRVKEDESTIIYITGGEFNLGPRKEVMVYYLDSQASHFLPAMNSSRSEHSSYVMGIKLCVFGGKM